MPRVKPFIADMGRAAVKSAIVGARRGQKSEDMFDHIFAEITMQKYQRALARAGANAENFFIVNGVPYVIGIQALREGFQLKQQETRYTAEYYGVLGAIAMARLFQRSTDNVFWVGTHAPEDVDYIDDLLAAICNTQWQVEWCGNEYTFDVVDGNTIDEPLAGYYNTVLRADGQAYAAKNRPIVRGTTLMLDIGGYTTDFGVIDPNGEIDYTTFESRHIGILENVRRFGEDMRTSYRRLLQGSDVPPKTFEDALATGVLDLRGLNEPGTSGYDVSIEAAAVRSMLANDVVNFYETYGGAAQYNTLILTGGGTALLEKELRSRIRHNNIVFADDKPNEVQMANARGARKWYQMMQMMGVF